MSLKCDELKFINKNLVNTLIITDILRGYSWSSSKLEVRMTGKLVAEVNDAL